MMTEEDDGASTAAADDQRRYRGSDRGAPPPSSQDTALHASERALLGYCSFHHLLLAFCERFPPMRVQANQMAAKAIAGQTNKETIPDLGVMLALLTVTEQSWSSSSLAWALLGESLDRNVRWVLPKMPVLKSFERPLSPLQANEICKPEKLLAEWVAHTTTSRRVLMFQAYFLTQVGRPQGSHPSTVLNHYNKSLGRPTARMVERLRVACGEIAGVSDWPGFFARLGLPLPSQCQVATRLRNAVVNSATKGYHGSRTDGRHGASRRQGERQPPRRR